MQIKEQVREKNGNKECQLSVEKHVNQIYCQSKTQAFS